LGVSKAPINLCKKDESNTRKRNLGEKRETSVTVRRDNRTRKKELSVPREEGNVRFHACKTFV